VATALFRAAEEAAKAGGALRLDLMVWDFNRDAMAFYQAMGMTPQRYILEKKL
jgi:GNAT superfamily N-acetyltransferase